MTDDRTDDRTAASTAPEAAQGGDGAPVVEARGLSKHYGSFAALKNATFSIPLGRIYGVIGANGAGKTTMLDAILGLIRYEGEVRVLGRDPSKERDALMEDVCFIADVATLPRWMRVDQVIDFVDGVHPKFDRATAERFLSRTDIPPKKRIKALSKGMITQLHLAIVMGIDAKLLVLDEPTLGLDIIFRKNFYASLLEEYFDQQRTIIVTTHQVEEVEHILTDVMFIRGGEIALEASTDALEERFAEVVVDKDKAEALRALGPVHERAALGRVAFAFEGKDRAELKKHGEVRRMGLADIFVAMMSEDKS